jgi:ribokinase
MDPRATVLVVGSVNVDLVVRIGRLPMPGETVTGGTFSRYPGGKGANQAVAAARLGSAVTFAGAVGTDEFGEAALADLAAEGIDVSRAIRMGDAPTGVALITVDEQGENQIAVASGANARLNGRAVAAALHDFLVPGGVYLANLEVSDEAVIAGAEFAARQGMTLLVNPAPARELPVELMALHPVLLPNELEARALTGESDPQAACRQLSERSGAAVIVTLGADGALLLDDGRFETIAAPRVEVVDTTGAGDAFAGALAAELARGQSVSHAAHFAVIAASLSVSSPGARGGMPTRAQVEAFRG